MVAVWDAVAGPVDVLERLEARWRARLKRRD